MAKINSCRFCKLSVVNENQHLDCWQIFCEDLLARVQEELKATGKVSEKLKRIIGAETFKTRDEISGEQLSANERALQKKVWELARYEVVSKAAEKWEKSHPDPDPARY